MIIYMIVMILASWLVFKTKIIKLETLKLFFDVTIFIVFIDLYFYVGIENKDQIKKLFLLFMIYSMIFIIYNLSNYILININKIINKINKNKREVIKKIFMKPIVFKLVYWGIWMLPWNVAYYVYFWWMEYGWYLRVWINSTRDIILWKLFKWDSRGYFYLLKERKENNKIYKIVITIYNRIRIIWYRWMLLLYYIRRNFLKTTIEDFIKKRIIVFMYLSIYYNYFMQELHYLNTILYIIIFIIEIMIIIFIGEIIIYIFIKDKKVLYDFFKNNKNLIIFVDWIINPIKNYTLVTEPYIIKNTIWDVTLSNSVSLNILYRWIMYVNNNTEGYYYYKMRIKTSLLRYKINDLIKEESVIWDVLPKTRYVIISLRYNFVGITEFKEEEFKEEMLKPNFTIEKRKNLYLSFFEKTYNGNSSLLLLIWILRNNFAFYTFYFKTITFVNPDELDKFYEICYNHLNQRLYINIECLLKINKDNKYLLPDEILLRICKTKFEDNVRDLEGFVLSNIFKEENINLLKYSKDIPNDYVGIKKYKEIFELMGYMTLYEEEGITWNSDLQKAIRRFSIDYNFSLNKENMNIFFNNIKNSYYLYWNAEFWESEKLPYIEWDYILVDILLESFKIKFQENIDIKEMLENNVEKIKIIDYGTIEHPEFSRFSLLERIKGWSYMLSKISRSGYKYNDVYDDAYINITDEEIKEILKKFE